MSAGQRMSSKMRPGYRLPSRTAVLDFSNTEWDGAWVEVRLDVPIGVYLELEGFIAEERFFGMFKPFGDSALVEWNLEEEGGASIAADGDGMKLVSPRFARFLIDKWMEVVASPPAPLPAASVSGNTLAEA